MGTWSGLTKKTISTYAGGQSRQLLSLPSCFVSLQPQTSRHCRANSSFSLPLGDLPSSFYLPSGHRISQFLSYNFAFSASLNRNRSIFPATFLFVAPRRLQTTSLDLTLHESDPTLWVPLSSDYLYCSSLRSQKHKASFGFLLSRLFAQSESEPKLSAPRSRSTSTSISARTRHDRTF
jgi:hypothetical protein